MDALRTGVGPWTLVSDASGFRLERSDAGGDEHEVDMRVYAPAALGAYAAEVDRLRALPGPATGTPACHGSGQAGRRGTRS